MPSQHWDSVDEAGAESFPASDPPAHGSSHEASSPPPKHLSIKHVGMTVAIAGALVGAVLLVRHLRA
jgi:hypothetical protein